MAVADGLDAGVLRGSAWIIRRVTMRVERAPQFSEQLELRTWCSGFAKSFAERSTEMIGDLGARVRAEAIWVHVDPELRRPSRLPQAFLDVYAESAAGHRPRAALRHPSAPPADAERSEWSFARADVDIAGHVNNTMYWRVAEEHFGPLPAAAEGPVQLEAEYRSGIGAGPAEVIRSGGMLWLVDPEGAVAATLAVEAVEPAEPAV